MDTTQVQDSVRPQGGLDPMDVFDVLARATAPYIPKHRADVPVDSVPIGA